MTGGDGRQGGRLAQAVFLLAVAAYMMTLLAAAPALPGGARLFPVWILAIAVVFVTLKGISVASPAAHRYLEPDASPRHDAGAEAVAVAPTGEAADSAMLGRRRLAIAWLWVVGAVASMYLIGFLLGTAVSVFVYLRFVARETVRNSSVVAGATLLFAYLVFARAMHIDFDFGLAAALLDFG